MYFAIVNVGNIFAVGRKSRCNCFFEDLNRLLRMILPINIAFSEDIKETLFMKHV